MARRNDLRPYTTTEKADKYDALMPLLDAMTREFRELSKKKPDGVLNRSKVTMVNRLLKDVLTIVEGEPSRPYLDLLDEEALPQYSDVLLVLSQFEAAMKSFHGRYYIYISSTHERSWSTN